MLKLQKLLKLIFFWQRALAAILTREIDADQITKAKEQVLMLHLKKRF